MVKELNINIISPIAELFEKQLSLDWESNEALSNNSIDAKK